MRVGQAMKERKGIIAPGFSLYELMTQSLALS